MPELVVERNLLAALPHLDPAALRSRVAQAADALGRHTHEVGDIETAGLIAVNPKDRHVVATAITNGANLIVTNDRRLRREVETMGQALRAVTADDFVQHLLTHQPEGIEAVIATLVVK